MSLIHPSSVVENEAAKDQEYNNRHDPKHLLFLAPRIGVGVSICAHASSLATDSTSTAPQATMKPKRIFPRGGKRFSVSNSGSGSIVTFDNKPVIKLELIRRRTTTKHAKSKIGSEAWAKAAWRRASALAGIR